MGVPGAALHADGSAAATADDDDAAVCSDATAKPSIDAARAYSLSANSSCASCTVYVAAVATADRRVHLVHHAVEDLHVTLVLDRHGCS